MPTAASTSAAALIPANHSAEDVIVATLQAAAALECDAVCGCNPEQPCGSSTNQTALEATSVVATTANATISFAAGLVRKLEETHAQAIIALCVLGLSAVVVVAMSVWGFLNWWNDKTGMKKQRRESVEEHRDAKKAYVDKAVLDPNSRRRPTLGVWEFVNHPGLFYQKDEGGSEWAEAEAEAALVAEAERRGGKAAVEEEVERVESKMPERVRFNRRSMRYAAEAQSAPVATPDEQPRAGTAFGRWQNVGRLAALSTMFSSTADPAATTAPPNESASGPAPNTIVGDTLSRISTLYKSGIWGEREDEA